MAGMFDNSEVFRVQQATDIADVIAEHVSLSKKGKEMVGLCPFHQDNRPSMYVSNVKQIFKCFACGAGGDVFKFIQLRENLTFPQAVERLADRAGIKLEKRARAQSKKNVSDVDPNMLARVNEWAAKYFQKNLADEQKGEVGRDYLTEREINAESMKQWRIGLAVSGNDLISTAGNKIDKKLLSDAGLASGFRDKFENRLMFTITDVTGRVIGFGGRTLDGSGAKYINSPATVLFDKSNCVYGLEQSRHEIVSTEVAVVVEGYTDVIMAHQFGCKNVVATLGTSFTAGHARILRRYAKKVVLVFDSDVAGVEAANRALDVCLAQRIDIKVASIAQGKDPCDFLLASGKESFEKLVHNATDVFEFKWARLAESFEAQDSLAGKKAAIEEFLQTIATSLAGGNLSAIERGLIVNRLSRIIGLDSKEINSELNKRVSRSARTASYNVKDQQVRSLDQAGGLNWTAQREILEVLLNEPNLFGIVKSNIKVDDFDVPILAQSAKLVFEVLDSGADTNLAAILARTESVELGRCIVELAEAGEEKGNFQLRLTGALEVMKRLRGWGKNINGPAIKDQKQFLESLSKNIRKDNPHNIGMI
ncbi:DNA primase [Planctomycetota bacterium]